MLSKLTIFKKFDWILFISVILLLAIGISILYSTTLSMIGEEGEALRQLIFALIGLAFFFGASFLDYTLLKRFSRILYLIELGFLVVIFVLGKTAMGATRWIDLGFFQLQPSEIAKLLMIIVLAKYFAENHEYMNKPKHIAKSFIFMAIPLLLVALQPDLGTAFIFLVIWLSMVIVSNINKVYLAYAGVGGVLSLPIIWQFLADYQKHRIEVFIDPSKDPTGTGWNIKQALVAIGSGGFIGRGLGHGPQSQLNFIPEKHTDFIFAALAEEMGFLGVSVLLGLFLTVVLREVRIAKDSKDLFGMYLSVGIVAFIFFHVFVNVGMNVGLMPVTGIPLPLISAGGTSVIIILTAIGLLQSVSRRSKKLEY